jgi:hypothetical protein
MPNPRAPMDCCNGPSKPGRVNTFVRDNEGTASGQGMDGVWYLLTKSPAKQDSISRHNLQRGLKFLPEQVVSPASYPMQSCNMVKYELESG